MACAGKKGGKGHIIERPFQLSQPASDGFFDIIIRCPLIAGVITNFSDAIKKSVFTYLDEIRIIHRVSSSIVASISTRSWFLVQAERTSL